MADSPGTHGNEILADLNPQMPQIRYDTQRLADLADVYGNAAPDLLDGLWPAPYLVMDTAASVAPYNHVELGQPSLIEYVWGRQSGEHTINPWCRESLLGGQPGGKFDSARPTCDYCENPRSFSQYMHVRRDRIS